jgi:hypothetical protein
VALGPGWGTARAGEREIRDYVVYVDGKPRGNALMDIAHQDDGTIQVACETDLTVQVLLVKYRYSYRGREVWKDGRLLRLDSSCNDDGKRFQVSAVAEANGLRVRVNGQERLARADTWLTSYWTLPDAKLRDQLIPLMDADTGRDLPCRMQHVGVTQMPVAGEVQNVNHYHLTGKVEVDLWYDQAERLVRCEWMEDGHRTHFDLARIRR